MLWAWEQQVVDGSTDRFVLLALADHADPDEHRAYPSVGRIAARTGLSARTVQYALRRLVDTGVVTADEGGRRGTRGYTLGVPWGVHQLHPRRARGCKSCTGGAPAAPEQSVDGVKKTSNEDQEIRLARLRALRRGDAAAGEGSRAGDAAPDR